MADPIIASLTDSQPQSFLMRIPREIIDKIAEELVGPEKSLMAKAIYPILNEDNTLSFRAQPIMRSDAPATMAESDESRERLKDLMSFTMACKKSYMSGIRFLYRNPVFCFNFVEHGQFFIKGLTPANKQTIRHVRFSIPSSFDTIGRDWAFSWPLRAHKKGPWTWKRPPRAMVSIRRALPLLKTIGLQMHLSPVSKEVLVPHGEQEFRIMAAEEHQAFARTRRDLQRSLDALQTRKRKKLAHVTVEVVDPGPIPWCTFVIDGFPIVSLSGLLDVMLPVVW